MIGLPFSRRMNGCLEIYLDSSISVLLKGPGLGNQRNMITEHDVISVSEAHTTALWSPLHIPTPAPSILPSLHAMPIPPRNP